MEEQPSIESAQSEEGASRQGRAADFLKRFAVLLVLSIVGSALYALVVGPQNLRGFSDGLFIVGAVLMIVGLLPMVADIFNRSTVSFRRGDRSFEDVLEEERDRSKRDDKITYQFGICGVIVIALSFIVGFSA